MSWSKLIQVPAGQTLDQIRDTITAVPAIGNDSKERDEQVETAAQAVLAVIDSGVVGEPGAGFYVTLSGHANPNHQPASDWANDWLSISISQSSPVPVEQSAAARELQPA